MRLLLFMPLLILSLTSLSTAADQFSAPDYYPLDVGSKWIVAMNRPDGVLEMVNEVAAVDEINGEKLSRLQSSVNGNVLATEHLKHSKHGVTRHQFNGQPMTPPVLLLPEPIELGKEWSATVKVGGQEMEVTCRIAKELEPVTVPAGDYDTIHLTVEAKTEQGEVISDYWMAKHVGIVRQELVIGEIKFEIELKEFIPSRDPQPDSEATNE